MLARHVARRKGLPSTPLLRAPASSGWGHDPVWCSSGVQEPCLIAGMRASKLSPLWYGGQSYAVAAMLCYAMHIIIFKTELGDSDTPQLKI